MQIRQDRRMSHLGQNRKNSVRANVFRVTPENGHRSTKSACLKRARKRHQRSSRLALSPLVCNPLQSSTAAHEILYSSEAVIIEDLSGMQWVANELKSWRYAPEV